MKAEERLHALDAVRAYALLLGIVLHATMSFLPALAAGGWPIVDNAPSEALSVTFTVIHVFRMTTFFVMAGFFARLMLYRRGTQGFIRDRLKRILMPMLVSWPVVMVMIAPTMVWALFKAGRPLTPPPVPPDAVLPFPLTHLWFLYVLLALYVCVLAARWLANSVVDRNGRVRSVLDAAMRGVTSVPVAPFLLAVPVGIALYNVPTLITWGGIPTPDNSLIPNSTAFVGYGSAILFGWFLHRQTELLTTFQRYWIGYSVAAVALIVGCISIGGTPYETPNVELTGTDRALFAGLYGLAIWCTTFAVIGAASRFLSKESKSRRYLADASYWMYILHLPIVFALQAWVTDWPLHWALKFTFILAVTAAILLLTYHYWVRSTYIGEVLNGRRYPRHEDKTPVTTPTAGNSPHDGEVLASLRGAKKTYGQVKALDGIDLDVRRGQLLAFLGPNGAGKSTAIGLLLGLQQPTSGTVRLFGKSPYELDARRETGVMMQEVTLAPELKVREHIDLIASYYPSPLSVDEVMSLTRISELAERPYRKLSGGQKRQVQFAMAICGRPKLLFLDEPTVGLDVQAREMMWQTIRKLIAGGCSIVLTTHYLEEAEALADRVVVVNKGRIIADGSVAELRSLVSRRQVSCVTRLPIDLVRSWTEIETVTEAGDRISITTSQAEIVTRRLLSEDAQLSELEIRRAGLAEAFSTLTRETGETA